MIGNFTDNQKTVLEVISTKIVKNFKEREFKSYSTWDSRAWFNQLHRDIIEAMGDYSYSSEDNLELTPEEKASPEFRIALMKVIMKLLREKTEIGNMHRIS